MILDAIALNRSPEDRRRTAELLEGPVDWDRLLFLGQVHGLKPLLYVLLSEAGSEMVPKEVLDVLRDFYAQNRWRNMEMLKELLKILQDFKDEGIRVITLKGPLLAQRIYGNLAHRWIADLDLFVRREDVLRTRPLLEKRGYRPDKDQTVFEDRAQWENEWEWGFDNLKKNVRVEIQWRTMPEHSAEYECLDEGVWDRLATTVYGGVEIQTLSLEESFLYACIHGGEKHLWCDMRFLVDMGRMLECDWEIDWRKVLEKAKAMGREGSLTLAFYLARNWGGANLPEPIREWARFTAHDDAMAGLIRGRVFRKRFGLPGFSEWLAYTHFDEPGSPLSALGRARAMVHYLRAVLTPDFNDRAVGAGTGKRIRLLAYLFRPYRLFKRHGSKLFRRLG